MPRRKRSNSNDNIGVGMTAKQMKRRKPINDSLLIDIEPLTHNQKTLFDAYGKGQNIVAYGLREQVKPLSLYIMQSKM